MPKYEIGFTVEAPSLADAIEKILYDVFGESNLNILEIQYANQKEED